LPDLPAWFPDWSGCAAVIVASGPSAKKTDLAILRQKAQVRVIAIKESYRLCEPDVIYGCDRPWWHYKLGMPDFKGLRIAYDPALSEQYPQINLIKISLYEDRVLLDKPGVIASGGNSGFQALNLAVQFGARQIALVGFDMHDRSGLHWYGRNEWTLANNPNENNFNRWRKAFALTAPILSNMGIDVANATRHSECKAFRFVPSVEVALQEWKI
jgi:hypothetical protein